MNDKPEIVAIIVDEQEQWVEWDTGLYCGAELIRLTDHEASRAADKARIAQLERALQRISAWGTGTKAINTFARAALAQQGKEGE